MGASLQIVKRTLNKIDDLHTTSFSLKFYADIILLLHDKAHKPSTGFFPVFSERSVLPKTEPRL